MPDILDLSGRGCVLQLDGDDAGSVKAIGLEIVEIVDPAQRALDRIGDLRLYLRRTRAVPAGGHDHFLQREAGIFVAPQRQELRRARDEEQRDQETHQGGVSDRPAGEVEPVHGLVEPRLDTGIDHALSVDQHVGGGSDDRLAITQTGD